MPEREVRSILRRSRPDLVRADPDETVCEAARRMAAARCGSVLVMTGDEVLGIFTERDLLVRVVAAGRDPAATTVRSVMTTALETIDAAAPVREAIRRMDEGSFRHLPVTEDGRILGVLSIRDIPVLDYGHMADELDARHRLAERIW